MSENIRYLESEIKDLWKNINNNSVFLTKLNEILLNLYKKHWVQIIIPFVNWYINDWQIEWFYDDESILPEWKVKKVHLIPLIKEDIIISLTKISKDLTILWNFSNKNITIYLTWTLYIDFEDWTTKEKFWYTKWNIIFLTIKWWNVLAHEMWHILDKNKNWDNDEWEIAINLTIKETNNLLFKLKLLIKNHTWSSTINSNYLWMKWKELEYIPLWFISKYSTHSINEDQAEIFEFLVTWKKNSEWETISEKLKYDPILKKKVDFILVYIPKSISEKIVLK